MKISSLPLLFHGTALPSSPLICCYSGGFRSLGLNWPGNLVGKEPDSLVVQINMFLKDNLHTFRNCADHHLEDWGFLTYTHPFILLSKPWVLLLSCSIISDNLWFRKEEWPYFSEQSMAGCFFATTKESGRDFLWLPGQAITWRLKIVALTSCSFKCQASFVRYISVYIIFFCSVWSSLACPWKLLAEQATLQI